ncbi:MAG: DUF3459 domain-containing protein [Chitinophagaceae bacterium]|nr:DUF3459 domain-containing protein [Chitinophagaceae bacterium]
MGRRFKTVEWAYNASFYEVNARQYTPEGTFKAFAESLPRLRDMGVDVLWFMPITPIGQEKRLGSLGSYYACSDYMAVNPEFGSLSDFKRLVDKAHRQGLKVIIDWVANHTAWDHVWTKTNPGYYKKNSAGSFYDNNGWNDVIDLNYYDHAMRESMIQAMSFWVKETGIDGFRCDMAHLVPLDFWRQARMRLDAIKPLFWLAETEHINYHEVFDCGYAWNWMHQSEKFVKGQIGIEALRHTLQDYAQQSVSSRFAYLFFTSNHDENSWNGTESEKYGPADLCFATLACTWNGYPLVYSGQELPNHKRLKFFDKDTIEWTGKCERHDFYKALLQLRARHPALSADPDISQTVLLTAGGGNMPVIQYLRAAGEKQVLVSLNLSDAPQSLQLETGHVSGTYKNIFTGEEIVLSASQNILLEPWGYSVLEK